MCGMCPGVVDGCWEDECCYITDGRKFVNWKEIGDTYCKHLQVIYGHEIATSDDYYNGRPEDDDE